MSECKYAAARQGFRVAAGKVNYPNARVVKKQGWGKSIGDTSVRTVSQYICMSASTVSVSLDTF